MNWKFGYYVIPVQSRFVITLSLSLLILLLFLTHVHRVPVKPNVCSMFLKIEIRKSRARRPKKQRRFVRVCSSVCLSDKKKIVFFIVQQN